MQHQLPLGFAFADEISLESFQPGENDTLLACVRSLLAGDEQHYLYIWGKPGTGKSHLLQAAVTSVAQMQKPVAYLPLRDVSDLDCGVLQGLEQMSLVCLDDIGGVAGNELWEEALFHLFNRCRDSSTPLIITASLAPKHIGILLKDLQSRLSWGITMQVKEISDADKMRALQQRAHARGMEVSDEVCQYLLSRYSRRTSDLFELLNTLDNASLAAHRKLTIPFVSQFLN